MAFLPTGFVDGGSVNGSMLRRLAWAAVSGESGVVQPGDLKVVAADPASAAVYVQAGTGFIPTRFSDAYAAQSYIAANDAAVPVAVPPNASGAPIVWELVLRATDPQYAGEPVPPDPEATAYVVAELVTALPTTKPYLRLATITMPAGGSAVTQAMITDRRVLVSPRRRRMLKALAVATSQSLSSTALIVWPATATWSIAVPPWATQATVAGTIGGVYQPGAQANASVQVRIGTGRADMLLVPAVQIDTDGTGNASRSPVMCPGTVQIPATMRGETVTVDLVAKRNSGASTIKVDTASAASLDIEFSEDVA